MQDLTITLVQANLAWEDAQRNLARLEELLQDQPSTDLIILPEMFTTGFTMQSKQQAENMQGKSVAWMRNLAREKNAVVTGSLIIEDKNAYYNRLIWAEPDTEILSYDKRHLFSLAGEQKSYSPGFNKIFPVIGDWKILPLICYDLRFPVWSRQSPPYTEMGRHPFDLLIYVANWPERRIYAWNQLLIARAIENQCYVAGVNRVGEDGNAVYHSGCSSVIDPMGEVLFTVEHSEAVQTMTLNRKYISDIRNKLPFLNDRDEFELKM
jgi:predicted amidohydrolase